MSDPTIVVGETAAGDAYEFPVEQLLTGRAFVTGKAGSGKSNTASVVAEELLERGHPFLAIDVDGEYRGLKQEYEVLHVGATEGCDLQVGPEHAAKLADLALDKDVPIVLDVSGYVDRDTADALVESVAHELFVAEGDVRRPFLLIVEEIHEYIPQQGSSGDVGETLIRIAKRGRKRGLGIMGLSQRPADVQKDFITQADLLVWHRLTWDNDTDVVKRVVGSEYADAVGDLDDGEAFVQADWSETDVARVHFRRKHTADFGATPGLDDSERPELKSIGEDLVSELEEISTEHERRQDRIAELEQQLDEKDGRIDELESQLDDAQDLQRLGEAFIDAAENRGEGGDVDRELLEEKNDRIHDLEAQVETLRDERDGLQARVEELEQQNDRLSSYEERVEEAERIEEQLDAARDVLSVDVSEAEDASLVADQRVEQLESENNRLQSEVNRLREQVRGDGNASVPASEGAGSARDAMLDGFQQEAAERIVSDIEALSERERRLLKYIEARGQTLDSQKAWAQAALGLDGNPNTTHYDAMSAVIDAGLVRKNKDGSVASNLRERVETELSEDYDADGDTIEVTYQRVLEVLAGSARSDGGDRHV